MIAWCLHDLIMFNSYHRNITVSSAKRGGDHSSVGRDMIYVVVCCGDVVTAGYLSPLSQQDYFNRKYFLLI